jgi:GNAT superfamily N-acetyltransferase
MDHGDEGRVMEAAKLFDTPPQKDAVAKFLADPNHHLLIAYSHGVPVGFVSGVEVTHPDKGTEMFLYELSVEEGHRHHGIGSALVKELAELAEKKGCYGMWVLAGGGDLSQGRRRRREPAADVFLEVWDRLSRPAFTPPLSKCSPLLWELLAFIENSHSSASMSRRSSVLSSWRSSRA